MSQKFKSDLRLWIKSRPEYAALTAAIRRDAPEAELVALADEAGVTLSEVSELCSLRKRAMQPNVLAVAAPYEAKKTEMAEVLSQIQSLEKKFALAKTRRESDEIESELYDLGTKRQSLMLDLAACQSAVSSIEAARKAGVTDQTAGASHRAPTPPEI